MPHLADGGVDVVVGTGVGGTDIVYRSLLPYELMLVVSEAHPLAEQQEARLEQVQPYPALLPTVGAYGPEFEDAVAGRLSTVGRVGGSEVLRSDRRRHCRDAKLLVTEEDRLRVVGIGRYPNRQDCGVYSRRLESLSPPVVDFLETLESSRDWLGNWRAVPKRSR